MQKALLLFAFISTSLLATAQTGSISGLVADSVTKEPVIGASILVAGTSIGASTDLDGKFTLKNIPAGAQTIIVTYVIYKTKSVANIAVVAGQTTEVTVELSEESKQLDEVVVT